MAQMLLMNPTKRPKKRRKTSTKRRTARKTTRRYSKNPVTTRANRVSRKARRASSKRRYRRNPAGRKGMFGDIQGQLINAAIGAGGALGMDVVMGQVPLPLNLKTGMAKHATKGLGAILMGMAGNMFLPRGVSEKMVNGALTVVMHDAMREQMVTIAPNLSLGEAAIPYYPTDMPEPELGYYNPGALVTESYTNNMGEYIDPGMGEYIDPGMGEYMYR